MVKSSVRQCLAAFEWRCHSNEWFPSVFISRTPWLICLLWLLVRGSPFKNICRLRDFQPFQWWDVDFRSRGLHILTSSPTDLGYFTVHIMGWLLCIKKLLYSSRDTRSSAFVWSAKINNCACNACTWDACVCLKKRRGSPSPRVPLHLTTAFNMH